MARKLSKLLNLMKSLADPTRLRLLAVLAEGELSVGELTQILGQSQPRISRHLKLLDEAGLLDRIKEEHSVYYRLKVDPADPALRLHELLEPQDPVIKADRERREAVTAERARRATNRLAELTADGVVGDAFGPTVGTLLKEELAAEPLGTVLDIGTGAGYLLKTLAPLAERATGVDISSDALRLARTHLAGKEFDHCFVRRGDMYRLPFADDAFTTVTLGRVLSHAADPQAVLKEATRVLAPNGRLVLIDDFDELETAVAGNPLARLREWLREAGLTCERFRPVDTGSSHLLVTLARRSLSLQKAA
jgi:DNA-binding transcriptional ArsR family regulator/precorrin-6B methylase 2